MFTINGLQHYSLPDISYTAAVNDSLQVYTMTNSTREFIKQKQVDDGHYMAYSAYTNRAKRAAVEHQYSETDCHNASEELSRLVNLAVFIPIAGINISLELRAYKASLKMLIVRK